METDVIFFLLLSFATMKQFFERLRSERSEEHERITVTYVRIIAGGGSGAFTRSTVSHLEICEVLPPGAAHMSRTVESDVIVLERL